MLHVKHDISKPCCEKLAFLNGFDIVRGKLPAKTTPLTKMGSRFVMFSEKAGISGKTWLSTFNPTFTCMICLRCR